MYSWAPIFILFILFKISWQEPINDNIYKAKTYEKLKTGTVPIKVLALMDSYNLFYIALRCSLF